MSTQLSKLFVVPSQQEIQHEIRTLNEMRTHIDQLARIYERKRQFVESVAAGAVTDNVDRVILTRVGILANNGFLADEGSERAIMSAFNDILGGVDHILNDADLTFLRQQGLPEADLGRFIAERRKVFTDYWRSLRMLLLYQHRASRASMIWDWDFLVLWSKRLRHYYHLLRLWNVGMKYGLDYDARLKTRARKSLDALRAEIFERA